MAAKYLPFAAIAGLVVIFDQATKAVILGSLALHQSVPVIPGFFSITHIHNPGGAFGFLADSHSLLRHGIFLVASGLAMGLILYFYHRTPRHCRLLGAGFALIFGGAAGNMIDRVRLGIVVDFLDLYAGRLHWPAFNVADSAISVGIVIFAWHLLTGRMPD